MREFNGVDSSRWTHDVSDVRHGCSGRGTEVEDCCAGLHVDVVEATEDTGCELRSEGVPDSVLDLGGWGDFAVCAGGGGGVDGDSFLAVDGFARCEVLGDEKVFFAAAGDEDAGVTMGFLQPHVSICVQTSATPDP